MNGGSDIGRWALEDEQLEELLSGASPDAAGLVGNPVAEFFADANLARGVARPSPSPSLQQLFTSGAPPATFDATSAVSPQGSILGGPPTNVVGPGALPPDQTEALPLRRSLAEFSEAEPQHHIYRWSPIEAAIAVLKPTGTKLLMAAALLVISAVGVEALGIYDFALLPTGRPQGDTIDIAAAGRGNLEDQARLPTTVAADSSTTPSNSLPEPGVLIEDERPAVGEPSTVLVPSTGATTEPPTTTTVISTADPETTTISTDTVSTTVVETTSTETVTTDTSLVDTTVVVTGPVETTVTVGSTVASSSTTLAVTVGPGRPQFVPADLPAGAYGAVAPRNGGGCTVRILRGSGGETSIFTRAAGVFVAFTLVDGDGVQLGTGCPSVFAVS